MGTKSKTLEIFTLETESELLIPVYLSDISAGFPSPADDYIDNVIDLNKELIGNPSATFCVRVQGDSMIDANINDGDILVVDRSITAQSNHIVLAILDGEFTVKRFLLKNNIGFLVPENKKYTPIQIFPETDFEVWGVVTYIIHKAQKCTL